MTRFRTCLTSCAMLLSTTAAVAQTDPLEGYEVVTPASDLDHPAALPSETYDVDTIARGKYLVELLRCGACHTDGALIGEPRSDRLLAGSTVGIAYTNPMQNEHPGVVYPSNLTPDAETGLGAWREQQIVRMIREGTDNHGRRAMAVMPTSAYYTLKDEDARAIAAYLLSLPPVRHEVPRNAEPGEKAPSRFVHFGVYESQR